MNRSSVLAITICTLSLVQAPRAQAHCQIPCGIYDDHNRVHQIREDITTIEKSMRMIKELAKKKDAQSKHQLVRWVVNKEHHAEKIIRSISDYFMAQKLKPIPASNRKGHADYVTRLVRHHAVMVAAMTCKQKSSMDAVQALRRAVNDIAGYWPATK